MVTVTIDDIQPGPTHENAVIARLQLPGTVNFRHQLDSLRNSGANDLLDEINTSEADCWIERPVWLDNKLYLMRLTEAAPGSNGAVTMLLRLQADDEAEHAPGPAQVRQALEQACRRFWWQLDMEAVRQALSVDDYGQELVAAFWPLCPPNLPGPWEGLLKTVISVQIYPGLATRLQQGLFEFYTDRKARFNGRLYGYFPSPEYLAEVIPEDLVGMKFSRQKARYLPAIARLLLDQPERYSWEVLNALPGPEAVARLDELPGVGPWIAHYVGMRGLPHPDVFIVEDTGLRKFMAGALGKRPDLPAAELAQAVEKYAPYRSMACYYSYMKLFGA